MRTHVEFTSNQFPSYHNEEEGINFEAGIFGKRLAEYLKEKLKAKGVDVTDAFAEDWGWCLTIAHSGNFSHFIGCANAEDKADAFRCFIEPGTPYIRKLFKKIDVRETVEKVANALDEVLREDESIANIQWVSKEG